MARPRTMLPGLLAALLLASCGDGSGEGDGGSPQRTSATVEVVTFEYVPRRVRVTAGATVTWLNQDEIEHTVTSGSPNDPDGAFNGALDRQGASFIHTFSAPGTFPYFCSVHPAMTGEIVVTG